MDRGPHDSLSVSTPKAFSPPVRVATLPKVHLASRSPRRRELLTGAGIEHDAAHPGMEDGGLCPGNVPAAQWAMALAYLKAASALRTSRQPGSQSIAAPIVLGADTVVLKGHRLIGTPTSPAEARDTLLALRSGEHYVITGVALLHPATGQRLLFCDSALVRVGELTDAQIDEYVASGAWQGKAGGYNLAERLEAGWPLNFEGDPTTVMGLPMRALVPRLERFASRLAALTETD